MKPPVAAVSEAHGTLERLVAGVNDQQVAEASALPGWSRGHVLAHLTDNARMFTRIAEHALRGELVAAYDGGMDERNAIIEATAGRSADEHRAELARHTARLQAAWARVGAAHWSRPVTFRNADLAATVRARWREVWIHMTDLELGVRPDDWPEELACHAVDFLLCRLPVGTLVRAQDVHRRWSTGDDPATVVTGQVRDLAAWLAGRTPTVPPVAAEGMPALGPWPPHPPQQLDAASRNARGR
ncbi:MULTISPECIES: maleylpyruvate isomerase family mycothiol-dependent enzyme [unclassified Streptomyces]|uniref:maleylpyruvate isomerase family mycothiol-dependent enzyme n=1 Tax=unclassified Streptomyces TaxID=2593676 RepID=UPI002DD7AB64|nr:MULTISPECIES: maleylpyruvate isomerase family mycothiol-dependent enzyme [unclassified Streptomyces]WSB80456.1 maleylpyruvate isomerase family mycothiol-dependent enzyme [Streptomyces sp. NBC_01775]WSS11337.1 maleylpyruvate isomerase family mycothiol-dependent enzyme [Streptomyces sp. NBC_01186]WSS40047.1 maleylpyruvate isomerase family mycothiol-dependent enzyme [Streptomyces sp. NBC_01187]